MAQACLAPLNLNQSQAGLKLLSFSFQQVMRDPAIFSISSTFFSVCSQFKAFFKFAEAECWDLEVRACLVQAGEFGASCEEGGSQAGGANPAQTKLAHQGCIVLVQTSLRLSCIVCKGATPQLDVPTNTSEPLT